MAHRNLSHINPQKLNDDFKNAENDVKSWTKIKPTDNEWSHLYGLHCQAMYGDIDRTTHTISGAPIQDDEMAMRDLEHKKRRGWEEQKGVSKDEAMVKYVELANQLRSKFA